MNVKKISISISCNGCNGCNRCRTKVVKQFVSAVKLDIIA